MVNGVKNLKAKSNELLFFKEELTQMPLEIFDHRDAKVCDEMLNW